MKIGLLTYFRIDVAGQYFQALATVENLKQKFPDCKIELINIVHEKKRGFRPSRHPAYFLPSIIRHLSYDTARRNEFTPILSGPLLTDNSYPSVEHHLSTLDHDVFVVGADTCLKVDHHYKDDTLPFFWLSPKLKQRKIMLSASAEYTDSNDLSTRQQEMIRASVEGFSFMGVRDRMTYQLVQDHAAQINDKLVEIPDPTIPWVSTSQGLPRLERLKKRTGKKLCGTTLAQTPFSANLLRKLSGEYHFVSINTPQWPGGSRIAPGPREWLDMFVSFDLMLTASFHETIFSFKAGIPVVSFDSTANRFHKQTGLSKARCLLETFELPSLYVNSSIDSSVPGALEKIHQARRSFPHEFVKTRLLDLSNQYWQALDKIQHILSPT